MTLARICYSSITTQRDQSPQNTEEAAQLAAASLESGRFDFFVKIW
jgi:hypothetical protein